MTEMQDTLCSQNMLLLNLTQCAERGQPVQYLKLPQRERLEVERKQALLRNQRYAQNLYHKNRLWIAGRLRITLSLRRPNKRYRLPPDLLEMYFAPCPILLALSVCHQLQQ